MCKKYFLILPFLIFTLSIQCFAAHEKVGVVLLHGLGGNADTCREWINFAGEHGVHSANYAVYTPEGEKIPGTESHSWFDVNPLWPDLAHLSSSPQNQTPENIHALLNKVKSLIPNLQSLKNEIHEFSVREEIEIKNLHFVGYSQGGILAQIIAYSLPEPCGSLFFAGSPWIPDGNIQRPNKIIMAMNKDDPLFGKISEPSREAFKKIVGPEWFDTCVTQIIEELGGHDISSAAKIAGVQHFKEVFGIVS